MSEPRIFTEVSRKIATMEGDIEYLKRTLRELSTPFREVQPSETSAVVPSHAHASHTNVTTDNHHAKTHGSNHRPGGTDEFTALDKLTGWDLALDETDVTIAMNDGTRTFTISPQASMVYWIAGIPYTISAPDTVVIDDTEGIWFIYYVGSALTASQTPWDIAAADKVMVAIVYWDATNNATITIGWEFHTWVMDPATHEENHHTLGTRFRSGLAVSDNGDDTVNVTAGIVYDEDIKIDITDGVGGTLFEQDLSPAKLPLLYRDGANGDWRKFAAATTEPVIVQATDLKLNEFAGGVWQLTSVTNNKYIAYWILATDDISEPVISIPGQVEGLTAQAVRDANPLSSMSFGSLPVAEYKVIARMIVQGVVGGNFFNISEIDDFRDVSTEPGTGTTITDHSNVTGVTPSQHHVKYTDGEAEAVIIAELLDGESIDVAIDNLIETHGLIWNAHHSIDDTPVDGQLEEPISSNWAFDHTALNNAADMIGSGNAAWVPCKKWQPRASAFMIATRNYMTNTDASPDIVFRLGKATNRGGLKLYVSGLRWHIKQADGANYITTTFLDGITYAGAVNLDTDATNINSVSLNKTTWQDTGMGALDCSSYVDVEVYANTITAAGGNLLDVAGLELLCYYAA